MAGPRTTKPPLGKRSYGLQWAGWMREGDTLASSSWSATPDGLVLAGPNFTPVGDTSVVVSGGEAGKTYKVTNRVTTTLGDEWTYSITMPVKEG